MTVTLSQTIGICCHCSTTYFNCGQNILIINSILLPKNYAHVVILYFDSAYLEKEMATHSSTLAWKIPWTEEPGRLQPMGSQRVGHDWATSLSTGMLGMGKAEVRRRRAQQRMRRLDGITDSMDVSWSKLGDSEGQASLACCSPWGHKEADTTKQLNKHNKTGMAERKINLVPEETAEYPSRPPSSFWSRGQMAIPL